jgi:hypothetical protein
MVCKCLRESLTTHSWDQTLLHTPVFRQPCHCSATFDSNLEQAREVLHVLIAARCSVSSGNLLLAVQGILLWRNLVSLAESQIDPAPTKSVHAFPKPKHSHCIARLSGMTTSYRKFIPNFADVAATFVLCEVHLGLRATYTDTRPPHASA